MKEAENNSKKELVKHKDEYLNTLQKKQRDFDIPPPSDIERAAKVMHQNLFHPKLTVGWLREQCRLNGNSFSARFKHYTGQHPKRYILHHRIEAGKLLLTKTNVSITAISLALGFSSHAAFSKAFKRKTEHTPSQWRENVNK